MHDVQLNPLQDERAALLDSKPLAKPFTKAQVGASLHAVPGWSEQGAEQGTHQGSGMVAAGEEPGSPEVAISEPEGREQRPGGGQAARDAPAGCAAARPQVQPPVPACIGWKGRSWVSK